MKIKMPSTGISVTEDAAIKLWHSIESMKLPFGPEYLLYKYRWTHEFCVGAIEEYRRFAYLALISKEMITPSESIDEVWHVHILHTVAYEQFAKLCGRKLHHSPGMPNEKEVFIPHYLKTHAMYLEVFGEPPPALYWPRGNSAPSTDRPVAGIDKVLNLFMQNQPAIELPVLRKAA